MHLLILTIEYPPVGGGASPVIHEINRRFIRKGHKVSVITMAVKGLEEHVVQDGIDVYNIKCSRIHKHMSNIWEHISFIVAAKKFLRAFIPKQQIDFCFTHFLLPSGILAKWLYTKYNIPYTLTTHGSDIPGFNPDRFRMVHWFTPPLIRSIVQSSVAVIAPSKFIFNLILQVRGIQEEKLVHITNGVDTDYYQPGEKKPIVLSTGRLLERKGFQYLIDAVADESFPFVVHICGDGPMMKTLREKAAKSKTSIVFHGWMNNKSDEYLKLLSEASFFVLVSAKENASISLLEGLSAGCVVITSNVSGCPETVGSAGICIPPADAHTLRAVLKDLTTSPDKAAKFMKEGRERAIKHFAWNKISDQYLSLIPEKINT
ncbi:MAG TPA: glycosyltransferase family 4 protein [Saprospiraceae bacterium]